MYGIAILTDGSSVFLSIAIRPKGRKETRDYWGARGDRSADHNCSDC